MSQYRPSGLPRIFQRFYPHAESVLTLGIPPTHAESSLVLCAKHVISVLPIRRTHLRFNLGNKLHEDKGEVQRVSAGSRTGGPRYVFLVSYGDTTPRLPSRVLKLVIEAASYQPGLPCALFLRIVSGSLA